MNEKKYEANSKAIEANDLFNKQIETEDRREKIKVLVDIYRRYTQSLSVRLYSFLWILLVVVEVAISFSPLKATVDVVIRSKYVQYAFYILYPAILASITIIISTGFTKRFNRNINTLYKELFRIKSNLTPNVASEYFNKDVRFGLITSIVFSIIFFTLLGVMANSRYQIINASNIDGALMSTQWLNILFIFIIGLLICTMGVYKEIVFKVLLYKFKIWRLSKKRDKYMKESHSKGIQALELEKASNIESNEDEKFLHTHHLRQVWERYYGKEEKVKSNNSESIKSSNFDKISSTQLNGHNMRIGKEL